MVTHDAYRQLCQPYSFLKDGEIFMELRKGNDSRSAFLIKF